MGASPDTEIIPAALQWLPPPLSLHQPRSQPRVSSLCPQAASWVTAGNHWAGRQLPAHCRALRGPVSILVLTLASCLAMAWFGAQRPTLPAGPACTCSLSPSLGSAAADLKSFSWPLAPGLSHPIASGCPDVLMNLPGQQLRSPVF